MLIIKLKAQKDVTRHISWLKNFVLLIFDCVSKLGKV